MILVKLVSVLSSFSAFELRFSHTCGLPTSVVKHTATDLTAESRVLEAHRVSHAGVPLLVKKPQITALPRLFIGIIPDYSATASRESLELHSTLQQSF